MGEVNEIKVGDYVRLASGEVLEVAGVVGGTIPGSCHVNADRERVTRVDVVDVTINELLSENRKRRTALAHAQRRLLDLEMALSAAKEDVSKARRAFEKAYDRLYDALGMNEIGEDDT